MQTPNITVNGAVVPLTEHVREGKATILDHNGGAPITLEDGRRVFVSVYPPIERKERPAHKGSAKPVQTLANGRPDASAGASSGASLTAALEAMQAKQAQTDALLGAIATKLGLIPSK